MKIKTDDLTEAALDWAVAKCEEPGLTVETFKHEWERYNYAASIDWSQGGPIIEREKLSMWWVTHYVDDEGVEYGNHWYAETGCTDENADGPYRAATGPTPLITAMRCYVATKLGDEIEIPEELK